MKNNTTIPAATFFYELLLGLYPKEYRKAYAHEMKLVFSDLYAEELEKNKEISIGFWVILIGDVIKSTFEQHMVLVKKIGIRKYLQTVLQVNIYSTVGFFLLLPFLVLFFADGITVLLTGSRQALQWLYKNPYWNGPIILTLIIIFPVFAAFINLYGIVHDFFEENHRVVSFQFLATHILSIIIFAIGFFAIILLFGHDFFPCVANGILQKGLLNFFETIQYCRINS